MMATITAQMVKELRGRTDLPMMECKQALSENDGDLTAAVEWLQQKHKGKLAERSDKTTGEGRIGLVVNDDNTVGAIVELQCETAPVAKHEMFIDLANAFAQKVADGSESTPDPEAVKSDPELDKQFTEVFGRMRENMKLTRCRRLTGTYISKYVHHDGKSGVLLALDAVPQSDKAIGPDLCMHTIFTQPLAIDRDGVSKEEIDKVATLARQIATDEGKPDNIVEKIVEGKINAFFGERVLMEQIHVKTDDYGKSKIRDVLKEAGVSAVTDFAILRVGA